MNYAEINIYNILYNSNMLTVVSAVIVSVITVVRIVYYDGDTTTLTSFSSLVFDLIIARSRRVVVTISSIVPRNFHNDYIKTKNDNDHD